MRQGLIEVVIRIMVGLAAGILFGMSIYVLANHRQELGVVLPCVWIAIGLLLLLWAMGLTDRLLGPWFRD